MNLNLTSSRARVFAGALLLASAGLAIGSGPASAQSTSELDPTEDYGLVMTHAPPPAAVAGQNLTLTATVTSACKQVYPVLGCHPVDFRVVYIAADGTEKVIRTHGASGALTPDVFQVTVPGADIRGSEFKYYLVADQWFLTFWEYYNTKTYSPVTYPTPAQHVVPVVPAL